MSRDTKPRLIHVAFTIEPTSNHIAAVVEILPTLKVSPHGSWDGCKGPVASNDSIQTLNLRGPFDPQPAVSHSSTNNCIQRHGISPHFPRHKQRTNLQPCPQYELRGLGVAGPRFCQILRSERTPWGTWRKLGRGKGEVPALRLTILTSLPRASISGPDCTLIYKKPIFL